MNALKRAAIPLCISALITACGGGGGGGSGTPALLATVTASQTEFDIGNDESITLTGASNAVEGTTVQYSWTVTSAPGNSTAQPENADSSTALFLPDLPGDYKVCLVVQDSNRTSGQECANLTATNSIPIAVPVAPSIILVGQQYQLDGGASLAPTGTSSAWLKYHWVLESQPESSSATLDDGTYVMPRFTADVEGTYTFSLQVSYDDKTSEPTVLELTASKANGLPVADAGDTLEGRTLGERVHLDGSGSYDPDGNALQYRWGFGVSPSITTGLLPPGSQATLTNADTATPSFVPDMVGSYSLWLQVYDGTSVSTDTVRVVVDQLPAGHVNTKPVAALTPNWGKTFEIELGSNISPTSTYSYDQENPPYAVHNIGKKWRLVSYPNGFDPEKDMVIGQYGTPEAPSMSITLSVAGDYEIELQVFDGELWSDPVIQTYTALTGANRPPIAKVELTGVGTAIGIGQTVNLDGEGSTDPDDNRLTYHWELISRPDGSEASLSKTDTAFPSFVADKAGPYHVELVVTDSHGFSSTPTRFMVFAKATNNAPVARPAIVDNQFSASQPLVVYPVTPPSLGTDNTAFMPFHNSVELVADAYDPDGDQLTYLWSLLNPGEEHQFASSTTGNGLPDRYMPGLCGNGYVYDAQGPYDTMEKLYEAVIGLRNWTCSNLNLAPANAATYRLQLLVSDGIDTTGPFNFTIPAVNREDYPTMLLERTSSHRSSLQQPLESAPDYAKQQVFPYRFKKGSAFPFFESFLEPEQRYILDTYQLTAFDQDYTISDLQALSTGISAEQEYKIAFEGLRDGQVINKGTTVTFSLVLETPATLYGWNGEGARPNLGEGLLWSFGITERPEWTFNYIPYIFPAHTRLP
ncbi:putative lipoprotein [Alcanivorax xiamenensis]|uniref:Lipoprotein n=1 Tax=Alcanivorax xiamenensis TaxID=1177156 RepID=A0ABQ6YC12_9GAMM|nr:PKD domain-containing protein [Alcanivorax xiamenensis]KAF0807170.1 putative lipoprotein [Alcanivorax xiamenensis]